MFLRSRLATCVAAVVAVVLAACGEGSRHELAAGRQAVLVAAGETAAERTARATARVVVTAGQQSFTMSGDGAVDLAGGRAAWRMTMPGEAEQVDTVVDGAVVYVQLRALLDHLAPGKRWVKLDFATLAEHAGADRSLLVQGRAADVRQLLSSLEEVSDEVKVVGREHVRGVSTTHYRALLDVRRAFEKLGAKLPGVTADGRTVPIDVWLDDAGRVRRLRQELDLGAVLPAGASGQPMRVDTTIELFDFGTAIELETPSPDTVADLAELLRGRP